MEIKFSKVLSTAQFIQQIINDRNGKFVFDGEFVEGMKVGHMHQVPSLLSTMTIREE
jgi:hypothetical protein